VEEIVMAQIEENVREKVKSLLKELFQFENQDLDFGIYKIMNYKRKQIEDFIEKDLIAEAERQFKEYIQISQEDIREEVDRLKREIISDFGADTLDDQGNVRKNEDAPKIKLYIGKLKDLEEASITQYQVADVFNHVYEFFSRYYDKGDIIPKRRYGGKDKYYIPYNGEEIALYWATKDMYYVKTGEFFKKYSFRTGRLLINFVLTEASVEYGNVKGDRKFFIISHDDPTTLDDEASALEIRFNYRALNSDELSKIGKREIQEALIADAIEVLTSTLGKSSVAGVLKPRGENEPSLLEKHLRSYVERNTRDFFIHKNLDKFLKSELEFYLKNEVWNLQDFESVGQNGAKMISAKVDAIHNISNKIIDFLSQIEDFQKRLFEKKKFVLQADYLLTLDLVPPEFYSEIAKNEGQVAEWKTLFMLDKINENTFYPTKGKKTLDSEVLKKHRSLVLDTHYFDDSFKDRLLATFDNIDDKIGGLIIRSENFQALQLTSEKYKERIKCIYLDPPYNTGEDGFLYKDNYAHSSWLSMMYTRLLLASQFLEKEGVIYVSIDDNEILNLGKLMDLIYDRENLLAQLIWNLGTGTQAGHFTRSHEYVLSYAREKTSLPYFESEDESPIQHGALKRISRDNPASEITFPAGMKFEGDNATFKGEIGGEEKETIVRGPMIFEKGRLKSPVTISAGWAMRNQILSWLDGKETYDTKGQKVLRFFFNKEGILWYEKERGTVHPKTVLTEIAKTKDGTTEIQNLFGERATVFPKPSKLIEFLVDTIVKKDDILLDFFAGSGTSASAIINLNNKMDQKRRFILVEMDLDCFNNILEPRIKKLMFSRDWANKLPTSKQGTTLLVKCLHLEQYEDTLNNIVFKESDKTIQETLSSYGDYFLRYMLDYETKESPTRLMVDKFATPFDYKITTCDGTEEKKVTIDLVETFNYLLGLDVESFQVLDDKDRKYKVVFGKSKNKSIVVVWRNLEKIDLQKDRELIENKILRGKNIDALYVNGDSYLKNARAIEPEFKRLMGA
jgi:adenine-specific DNA-methyltransferase